jgi:Ser/Thr protein kinase RdoA (MazF antagonist)
MTRDARCKKVVRRHAEGTGQRYTDALEGLGRRLDHEPAAGRLLAHLRDRYGIDAVAATRLSVHKTYVFRIDRSDGEPWVARAFPPARPRAGVEGDAAILRFLQRHGYPAERLAVEDAVSDFDAGAVLVTRFVDGTPLPDAAAKFAVMGELLGRLHALPPDDSVSRPGGASGEDPSREGTPRQDLLAALSFLDAVDTKVAPAGRERFEQLRDEVRAADDGHGLPEGLLHGNLLHAPDHVIVGEHGPVAINWKAAGRGPRLADLAYLI